MPSASHSLSTAAGARAAAAGPTPLRWRDAAAKLVAPGAVLAGAWAVVIMPAVAREGARGWALAAQIAIGPAIAVVLLISFVALLDVRGVSGRARTLAVGVVAIMTALLTTAADFAILNALVVWSAPPRWSTPVMWWANLGENILVCLGAVLVYDYRVRSASREAALREARLAAANMVRRTAEVRLQAMRARIDPRFLFDALSAVERVHDADAAAGNRLLDNLVTYLRGVVPDLTNTRSTVGCELDLAGVWLEIRQQIVGGTVASAVEEATAEVRGRQFPPMTMIALAEAVLADAPPSAALTIRASCEGRRTTARFACSARAVAEPSSVEPLRTRLRELYGESVRVRFRGDEHGRSATVEVDL